MSKEEAYFDTEIGGERNLHVEIDDGYITFTAGGMSVELPSMTDQQINLMARFLARNSA